jgi:hypothetical protein
MSKQTISPLNKQLFEAVRKNDGNGFRQGISAPGAFNERFTDVDFGY